MWKENNINIREELDELKKEYSIQIIYLRTNKYSRCKCVNELYKSALQDCPSCLGTGKENLIEMQNVIMFESTKDIVYSQIGEIATNDIDLYIDFKATPKVKDIIIIVGFDNNNIFKDVKRVYEISSNNPVRGDNGRVEYHLLKLKEKSDKIDIIKKMINRIPYNIRKNISKGSKVKCQIK